MESYMSCGIVALNGHFYRSKQTDRLELWFR